MEYEMTDEIRKYIKDAINKISDKNMGIKKGSKVAIKVNIMGPYNKNSGACTHPEIVGAVIEELKLLKVDITVYEDCLNDNYVKVSGIWDVLQKTSVPFVNLKDRPYVRKTVEGENYEYSKDILEADYLILIPKLKTHVLTNYTGSVKLMYGSIAKHQRKEFHRYEDIKDFSKILVDIFSIKLPILTVMDGIISMDGMGPSHGNPNHSGLLMISNDAVILDYYASKIMKYNPLEIDSIRIALQKNLATCSLDDVELSGTDPDKIKHDFSIIPTLSGKLGKRFRSILVGDLELKKELCTKCKMCIRNCPFSAISMAEYPIIDSNKCIKCYCCMELCPNGAYTLKRKVR